jgi:pilus assembly protein TadC
MASLYKLLARQLPDLPFQLRQARIDEAPEAYLKRAVMMGLFLAGALTIIAFAFTKNPKTLLLFPLVWAAGFFYFRNYAVAILARIRKEVSKEIVFAGRFLIVELESGVPVYDAFSNISKQYPTIGKYFSEILRRVDLGTPMEEALNEAVQLAPSNDLRRIFWQVLNSLKTGSQIASALSSVFDQIVREQQIAVKEYGRKLNPMAMFYMMIAVIVPSLGTIMLIVLSTFLGLDLNLLFFSVIIGVNVIVQVMFLAVIKAQRPPVDL